MNHLFKVVPKVKHLFDPINIECIHCGYDGSGWAKQTRREQGLIERPYCPVVNQVKPFSLDLTYDTLPVDKALADDCQGLSNQELRELRSVSATACDDDDQPERMVNIGNDFESVFRFNHIINGGC